MLVSVDATEAWYATHGKATCSHRELVAQTLAVGWLVQIKVQQIEANLTYIGVFNFNGQVTVVLMRVSLRVAGISKVGHSLVGYVMTGPRDCVMEEAKQIIVEELVKRGSSKDCAVRKHYLHSVLTYATRSIAFGTTGGRGATEGLALERCVTNAALIGGVQALVVRKLDHMKQTGSKECWSLLIDYVRFKGIERRRKSKETKDLSKTLGIRRE